MINTFGLLKLQQTFRLISIQCWEINPHGTVGWAGGLRRSTQYDCVVVSSVTVVFTLYINGARRQHCCALYLPPHVDQVWHLELWGPLSWTAPVRQTATSFNPVWCRVRLASRESWLVGVVAHCEMLLVPSSVSLSPAQGQQRGNRMDVNKQTTHKKQHVHWHSSAHSHLPLQVKVQIIFISSIRGSVSSLENS